MRKQYKRPEMNVQEVEVCYVLAQSLVNGGIGKPGDSGDIKKEHLWEDEFWDDLDINSLSFRF